jgi:RHS repeat-associated protein
VNLTIGRASRPIVDELVYTRDGLVERVTYGDDLTGSGASRTPTVSFTTYDDRRRPVRMRTTRTPNAHPELTGRPLEDVSSPHDQMLVWDLADNLIAIEDLRDPTEWPDGFRPQSVHVTHDSLYRVAGAEYEYTTDTGARTPTDASSDWRAEMEAGRSNDPMRTAPAPPVSNTPETRVASMQWEHDWLGNMQSWDDDAAVFYERSLGDIVNGADLPAGPTSRRTGALYVASNLPATPVTADDGGWVEVRYGEDGNALAVTVHGQCGDPLANGLAADCRPSGSSDPTEAVALSCAYSCAVEQHFTYAWDEVNRIAHARRFDRDRTSGPADWQLAVEQRYLYDASNQRTVKTTTFRGVESGAERTALYVYPGDFERRGLQTTLDRSSYEAISGDTETQYGVGGARIVWRSGTRDDGLDRDQRITIALTDLIQSTTAVIDLATGELVETGSYYANGARETYRSNESETVAPEPMGFTGKEADEEVGLTYFGQRYLMAHLGRWASPDPLQTHAVGGGEAVNGYHYVGGNVLQARDPVGLDPEVSVNETSTTVDITVHLEVAVWGRNADVQREAASTIDRTADALRAQGGTWEGADGRRFTLHFDVTVREINASEAAALSAAARQAAGSAARSVFISPEDPTFPFALNDNADLAMAAAARRLRFNVVIVGGAIGREASGGGHYETQGATLARTLPGDSSRDPLHEMAHMMGLNERYIEERPDGGPRTWRQLPGFENNLMGLGTGTALDSDQIRWLGERAMDLARSGERTMSFAFDDVGPSAAFRGGGVGPQFRLRNHVSNIPPRSSAGCGCGGGAGL